MGTRRITNGHRLSALAVVVGILATGCSSAGEPGAAGTAPGTPAVTTPRATAAPGGSGPPPGTSTTAPAACVDLTGWSAGELAEQMLMVSGQFGDLSASRPEASAGVGALVLFGQPAAGRGPDIAAGIAALEASAAAGGQVPPWMATDEEGGSVARLAAVLGALPTPRQMAATWTAAHVQAAVTEHARAMHALGVTMDLAPVIDVAPEADVVADEADRAFGDDAAVVSSYGMAFARGLAAAGVLPVAKHFPGLGIASADTDLAGAVVAPLSQLELSDLVPFEEAVTAGVPVVMVGHAVVPGLTAGLPASLSPATYALLRNGLGSRQVALTDSLGALAVADAGYSEAHAAVTALEAGADMAMVDASQWPATTAAVEAALHIGALTRAAAEAAVTRILTAKGMQVCGR